MEFDVLIVGGGMVGASLAIALGQQGLRVGVLEAASMEEDLPPSYDDRAIALAYGTRLIFEGLRLWPELASRVEPIRRVHVSDRGRFGATRLDCTEQGVDALARLRAGPAQGQAGVELLCPAELLDFEVDAERVTARVERNGVTDAVTAGLLVAADGGRSVVRERLAIPVSRWQYGQTAVVTNITPERPHQGVAFERFTDTGPLALLPMREGRCAVVWTLADAAVDEVMELADPEFLARMQDRFGYRLGRLTHVGQRQAYPLQLVRARESVRPRVALAGNAAHTLHPVSGQGFNLGLRDVAVLADVITGDDPGDPAALKRYADWRRQDQRAVALFTDGLARLFVNPLAPVRLARNLGLLTLDLLPGLKRRFARRAMGVSGRLPRLSMGRHLD